MNQKNRSSSSPIIGLPLQGQPQVQERTAASERVLANRIYRRAIWQSIRDVLAEWFGRARE